MYNLHSYKIYLPHKRNLNVYYFPNRIPWNFLTYLIDGPHWKYLQQGMGFLLSLTGRSVRIVNADRIVLFAYFLPPALGCLCCNQLRLTPSKIPRVLSLAQLCQCLSIPWRKDKFVVWQVPPFSLFSWFDQKIIAFSYSDAWVSSSLCSFSPLIPSSLQSPLYNYHVTYLRYTLILLNVCQEQPCLHICMHT